MSIYFAKSTPLDAFVQVLSHYVVSNVIHNLIVGIIGESLVPLAASATGAAGQRLRGGAVEDLAGLTEGAG